LRVLGALRAGKTTPEEIAAEADMSLYRVRSGLRQLSQVGYVVEIDGLFQLSDRGRGVL